MYRTILRRVALATAIGALPMSNAFAHCFVGARFFPATLVTDDPRFEEPDVFEPLMLAPAGRILHLHGAEGRLEVLGKPQRELARCARDRAADSWFGVIEKGVSPGGLGQEQDEQCR
jgi:hypothetical protein